MHAHNTRTCTCIHMYVRTCTRTVHTAHAVLYNMHAHCMKYTHSTGSTVYEPCGKKRRIEVKLHILSYSTGGSGMVSGLFSSKNFEKILIFRFTIFIFVFFKGDIFLKWDNPPLFLAICFLSLTHSKKI